MDSLHRAFAPLFCLQMFRQFSIWIHIQRIIVLIDHHAGLGTGRLFHLLDRAVIHRHILAFPGLGVIRRQLCRLQDALLVRLPALTGENYMASLAPPGPRCPRMEPV